MILFIQIMLMFDIIEYKILYKDKEFNNLREEQKQLIILDIIALCITTIIIIILDIIALCITTIIIITIEIMK